MNSSVSVALRDYIRRYRTEFAQLPYIQSQMLELGALILCAEHYRLAGYTLEVANLWHGKFRIKRTSSGRPWRFSWFVAKRGVDVFEIHANLRVAGAYGRDNACYVVDVGVCMPGRVKAAEAVNATDFALPNPELVTFVEAKRLTIYPMLVAQFIGIVNEIKPRHLGGRRARGFAGAKHFNPTMVTTGPWAKSCRQIYDCFPQRSFKVQIVPNLDATLGEVRLGAVYKSPFS